MSRKKLGYIDLFAGCGGLSDGFEQTSGYELLAAVEWEKSPHETLVKRLKSRWNYTSAEKICLRFDMQRTKDLLDGWKTEAVYGSSEGLRRIIGSKPVDVIIGGPPCQAYSIAGRIRDAYGMHNDYRNYLFESYLKIVRFFQPKAVVFENVEGMLSAKPGGIPIIERIKQGFKSVGYELVNDLRAHAVIDLSEYGVPQVRKRVILLALKRRDFKECQKYLNEFYTGILPSFKVEKKKTVREAIGDLPKFKVFHGKVKENGKAHSHYPFNTNIQGHSPRFHSKRDIEIFKELSYALQVGDRKYESTESLKELYARRTGKTSNVHKYYVLRWDKPSNTIVAHLHKDGLRHIHPDYKQARSLTVRESARLQTFDDDFQFLGSMGDQYKMIGNAVPPLFAHKLALAVTSLLNTQKGNSKRLMPLSEETGKA